MTNTPLKTDARAAAAEFLGTFIFMFCGIGAIGVNDGSGGVIGHVGISLCFGIGIMVMIYTYGPVSAAHFNPAVSLTMLLLKEISVRRFLFYLPAQFAGAALACLAVGLILGEGVDPGGTRPTIPVAAAVCLEIILTLVLLIVILPIATSADRFAISGLAIGATVAMASTFGGPLTGASMNPARSFGPALASGQWSFLYIYFAGPLIASLLATAYWKLMRA